MNRSDPAGGRSGMATVTLRGVNGASAEVAMHGAHVISFTPDDKSKPVPGPASPLLHRIPSVAFCGCTPCSFSTLHLPVCSPEGGPTASSSRPSLLPSSHSRLLPHTPSPPRRNPAHQVTYTSPPPAPPCSQHRSVFLLSQISSPPWCSLAGGLILIIKIDHLGGLRDLSRSLVALSQVTFLTPPWRKPAH